MINQVVTRVSLDSFRERSRGRKVILLYPWTNYRNLFLSHFLTSAKDGLLYYRIPSDAPTLAAWLGGLVDELNAVLGGFGAATRAHLTDPHPQPQALGEALADDLAAYATDAVVLFIDELDRVPLDAEFQQFVRALVSALRPGSQLAVSSRLLTHQPWYDMVAQGEAVILGTEHRKNNVMFTLEETPKPQLEVYSLGRGYALINGQQITNWDGALPRNLFFFFIDRPLVTRDEIFEIFWPNLTTKEATNVFHVTKRKISERIAARLDTPGDHDLTQYSSGFYMPNERIVRHYDVFDFLEAVEQALVAADEREQESLYSRAVDLYKAPFLQTVQMPWAENRREQLRQMYAQALIGLGRICQRRHDTERALGYYTRALREAPEREDIHHEVLRLYDHLGMYSDAIAQYRRLEEMLKTTVGIAPARETTELYEAILAKL